MSWSPRPLRRALSLPIALCALAACTTSELETPEEDAITAGQLVAGDSPYYWADTPYEQHVSALSAFGEAPATFLAVAGESDVLRQRLQAWVDKFDALVRQRTGNSQAPKPVVKVVNSSKLYNAFAVATLARVGMPFGPSAGVEAPAGMSLTLGMPPAPLSNPGVGLLPVATASFAHPNNWTRAQSLTQVWNLNNTNPAPCVLSTNANRLRATGAGCGGFEGSTAGDALLVAQSKYLTITSDFAATVKDEPAMVFTLGHELGHLYRAHQSTLTSRKYGFWYEQGPEAPRRPVAAAEAAKLREEYTAFVRPRTALDDISSSTLAPSARQALTALVTYTELVVKVPSGEFGKGLTDCAGYAAWNAQYVAGNYVARVSSGAKADAALQAAYKGLESLVQKCAPSLQVAEKPLTGSHQLVGSALREIATLFPFSGLADAIKQPDARSLQVLLARVQAAALERERREAAFAKKMNQNRIGLYTSEQEADEIAGELMVRAGFSDEAIVNALLSVMGTTEAFAPTSTTKAAPASDVGSANATLCKAMLDKGFKTDAGANVVMTLGDLTDIHHGNCYRVYNLWRELRAHRVQQGPFQQPSGPAWSKLAEHAATLTAQAKAAGL